MNIPLLQFHNKDLTFITVPNGERQGFFRNNQAQKPHWLPLDGITSSKHALFPAIAETRRYWENNEGTLPGEGNKALQRICKMLDDAKLPSPRESTVDPYLANDFLGTEASLALNDHLIEADLVAQKNDEKPLPQKIEAYFNSPQQKPAHWATKLLQLAINIGSERKKESTRALVPAKTILSILILTPILILGNLKAQEPQPNDSKIRVEQAYSFLQKMDGLQIKELLKSIPEDQRIALVKYLPDKLIPFFIPKDLAAKNVSLVPDKELKKGFNKISESEFIAAAKKLNSATQNQLFDLVIKATATLQTKKIAAIDIEPG